MNEVDIINALKTSYCRTFKQFDNSIRVMYLLGSHDTSCCGTIRDGDGNIDVMEMGEPVKVNKDGIKFYRMNFTFSMFKRYLTGEEYTEVTLQEIEV